jgi:hypothetical protein
MKRASRKKTPRKSAPESLSEAHIVNDLLGNPIARPTVPRDIEMAWARVQAAALARGVDPDDIVRIEAALKRASELEGQVAFYRTVMQLAVEKILPLADERHKARVGLDAYNQLKGYAVTDDERRQASEHDEALQKQYPVPSHRRDEIARMMGIRPDRVRTLLGEKRKTKPENRGKNKKK